jgi:BMFP domain-containing protein YqiC
MGEQPTHNLPDARSFEERLFARFDAVDAGLRGLNARMESLETRVQRLEDAVERKLDVFWRDMLTPRAEQSRLEDRIDKLEAKPAS